MVQTTDAEADDNHLTLPTTMLTATKKGAKSNNNENLGMASKRSTKAQEKAVLKTNSIAENMDAKESQKMDEEAPRKSIQVKANKRRSGRTSSKPAAAYAEAEV